MGITIRNPLGNRSLPWLKGNLHTHTGNSDGPRSPQGIVDEYAARGYDFLMLSDHDCLTVPGTLDARGMVLIPGNEITANGPHVLHVNARTVVPPVEDRQKVIDAIAADGGLSILCHPNWEVHFNHCPQEKLEEWHGYMGIEIYNGVVSWLEGDPLATGRWDQLLAKGRRIWGFANDDCHKTTDIGIAWNMVQADRRDVAGIVAALRDGRFYTSTGVTIEAIGVYGSTLSVRTSDASRMCIYSDHGYRRAMADDHAITFTVPDDAPYNYVRVECLGCGDRKAWTQPFFIERS